jgi:hypothetical protein
MNTEQLKSETLVRGLFPNVVILPSTSSSSYDNQDDHMKALDFHKTYGQLMDMAAEYNLKVVIQNA